MTSTASYTIHCLSRALSPITHMRETRGNIAILNRADVVTPEGVASVPVLSGNALRHRMLRAPGARYLVDRCGLEGHLSLRQLNFLFHGGSLAGSTARIDTAAAARRDRLVPFVRLLGGSLPHEIVPGSVQVGIGWLACRETSPLLRTRYPDVADELRGLPPAAGFIGGWQHQRSDAARGREASMAREDAVDEDQKLIMMLMTGEAILTGALIVHEIHLSHVSPLELGCALLSLSLWQREGGSVGGQSAKGHGRLKTSIRVESHGANGHATDLDAAVDAYVQHVDEHAHAIAHWLEVEFDELPAEFMSAAGDAAPEKLKADQVRTAARATYSAGDRPWATMTESQRDELVAGISWPKAKPKAKGKGNRQ